MTYLHAPAWAWGLVMEELKKITINSLVRLNTKGQSSTWHQEVLPQGWNPDAAIFGKVMLKNQLSTFRSEKN